MDVKIEVGIYCPPCLYRELLYSLMVRGTKEFLSLLVELDWDSSLPLNTLLCLVKVLCRGWWVLSSMDNSLSRVLFSATVTRESSSVTTTEPALLTSLSSWQTTQDRATPLFIQTDVVNKQKKNLNQINIWFYYPLPSNQHQFL